MMTPKILKLQKELQESCPHRNWLGIDRKNCDFFVRRSPVDPFETSQPEVEPGEERPYRNPSRALLRSYELAGEYKKSGYDVVREIHRYVHRITKPGEPPFYLFVDYTERRDSKPSIHLTNQPIGHSALGPQVEYLTQMIRVEKRALKVLKAVAERNDQPVSELLEKIITASLEGGSVFDSNMLCHIAHLKNLYGMDTNLQDDAEEQVA